MILIPSQSPIGHTINKMLQFGYKIYCLLSVILVVISNIGKLLTYAICKNVKQKVWNKPGGTYLWGKQYTPPIANILCVKNLKAFVVLKLKNNMLKIWKKSWEPFWSCKLNSIANPAHFHPSLAGLAVLFSRQLPNGSHNFFQTFSIFF